MSRIANTKGSLWRKWDLQVQTILDDGYLPLKEYSDEIKKTFPVQWAAYVAKVGGEANALMYDSMEYFVDAGKDKSERCVNYARNLFAYVETFCPDLACIGFTDHNYFDDVLLDSLLEYSAKSKCKAIPGVEINCNGIHMLLFFPTKLYRKETYSASIQAFLSTCGIHSCKTGSVLTVTSSDIKDIINEVRKNDGIVIYPHCNNDNGLFQERSKTDRTILAEIFNYQKINLLQSQHNSSCEVLSKYIKTNTTLKSAFCCHISSDARALKDIGKADQDGNYLWIKANPDFEGLRQIMHEPDQRLSVNAHPPEPKKSYFVIDKVRFLDNTGQIRFGSDPIEINQNLTAIIGGKSTGKSLLLYYTAKTINKGEVASRIQGGNSLVDYDLDTSPDFNFEVIWQDGQSTFLKPAEALTKESLKQRKILYIPQRYLNTLSEANIKSREAINHFILSVILQDETIHGKYDETVREINSGAKSISVQVAELFSENDDIKKISEELSRLGDEKGIETYIQALQTQAEEIKAKSGLTEEQLKKYEELIAKDKGLATQILNLEEDKKTLKNMQVELLVKVESVSSSATEYENYINDQSTKTKLHSDLKIIGDFGSAIKTAISNVLSDIETRIAGFSSESVKIKSQSAPLLAKVQLQTELQDKTDAIKKEQQKLNDIGIKKNALKTKAASAQKKADVLIDAYGQIFGKYESLRNELRTFESKFGDIALNVHIGFNEEVFNSNVLGEFLSKRDLKSVIAKADWGDNGYRYDSQKHIGNISAIFKGLLSGSVGLLKNRSMRDAIVKLFDNYFFLDFKIFYKGDSLDKMSPGKKGLVLLQLLVNLSNEEWPILLDQPEDDLDNRSVYDDLVYFLKKKKIQRQIIVVTHNPNLVVGADAEEVLVANQSGQEIGRENRKHRFEYVSEALENSYELDKNVEPAILYRKGIRQHVCEILEGGEEAFLKREQKYSFSKKR